MASSLSHWERVEEERAVHFTGSKLCPGFCCFDIVCSVFVVAPCVCVCWDAGAGSLFCGVVLSSTAIILLRKRELFAWCQ